MIQFTVAIVSKGGFILLYSDQKINDKSNRWLIQI
ncbi:UNVERIFIED_CONTAM: hypothetical protein BJ099_11588 [Lysinibacillus xylanilyticus]